MAFMRWLSMVVRRLQLVPRRRFRKLVVRHASLDRKGRFDRVEGRRGVLLLTSVSAQRAQNRAGNSSLHPARQ